MVLAFVYPEGITMEKLPQPDRRLVGLDEGAAYLGVCKHTLRRLVAAGKIPAYRIGNKTLRVDLNEVDALLLQPVPAADAANLLADRGGADQ